MNMMNKLKMRLGLAAAGVFGSAGSLLAQESTPQLDTTQATAAATSIKTGLVQLAQSIAPIIVEVILAVLAVVVIYKIVRWIMRAWNSR